MQPLKIGQLEVTRREAELILAFVCLMWTDGRIEVLDLLFEAVSRNADDPTPIITVLNKHLGAELVNARMATYAKGVIRLNADVTALMRLVSRQIQVEIEGESGPPTSAISLSYFMLMITRDSEERVVENPFLSMPELLLDRILQPA